MTQQWPPTPHQAPHQQGPAPQNFPYPPPVPQQKPERPAPVDVGTAAQLLWAVAGLGLIQALAAMVFVVGEKSTFVDELMKNPSVTSGEVDMSRDSVESLFYVGIGFTVVLMLILTGLFVLFVHFMRKGRNWARMLLTIACVMMVVWTVPVLFGIGSDGSRTALALGGVQILQAVVAVGAVVLMHRKDANSYFLRLPPSAE
ncbi:MULTISPECIES: hypothetical protein [unclassified Rhodococcus (in: high G+C Gram-positive bacteria)]|uniref:hypothetical protein n=1 Tax=unclassified Rhodococcus (in: high G+C Gram-positive bacteria) TaxID=192944 RepID=UPI0016397443|nr:MULTISPECIES: hypothetical protein [unclassified Rhodococcus (in: high G+C Gram-positive bacteria)]MBC2639406.1 hypothetical protein [Rhodococcus sp. 3A]MBC2895849.1 hypothetical protein [Rhodococcus sp. 4CII]